MKPGSRLRVLVTNAGALALGGIVAQGTFVAVEALIARQVGPHAYGIYSSSYVLIMLMAHFMDMGMYWKLVQDGSRDPKSIAANFGTMMVARIGLFILSYPLFLGFVWMSGGEPAAIQFFAMFAFFGLQVGMQELLGAVYTAQQRMTVSAVFQAAMPVAILAFAAVLVIPHPSLPRLAIAFVAGAAVITTIWTWQVWARERPKVEVGAIAATLRACFHYGVSGLIWNVYLRVGVLVLTFASGVEQVAFFAAAFKLIDLFFKIAVLTNRVVAPRLYADSHHRPDDFARTSEVLLRMTVAAGALGSLLLFVTGGWLVHLIYGAGFAASAQIIRILGISLTLKTISLIAQTVISAADDHSYRMRVVAIATVWAIAFAIPLAMWWGAPGVAYAVVGGDVVLLALLMWRVWRTRAVVHVDQVFALPLAGAIGCGLLVSQMPGGVIAQAVTCVAVFATLLWMSGYLKPVLALLKGGGPRTSDGV